MATFVATAEPAGAPSARPAARVAPARIDAWALAAGAMKGRRRPFDPGKAKTRIKPMIGRKPFAPVLNLVEDVNVDVAGF